MQSLIEKLETIVKDRMSSMNGTAHSYEHVKRVLRIAGFLAEKENGDLELIQAGAVLHDVGWVLGQPHNETGARAAERILKRLGCRQERRDIIVKIVLHHPLSLKDRLETLEEKIVWDADKIDLLGAIGVARGFHWCGDKTFEDSVKLAFETYTPIFNALNTPTAKEIARMRNERMQSFLQALKEELSVADLGIE